MFGSVVFGLIQGVTEFLPVSSTGHLVLLEHLLGLGGPGVGLEVALHAGTLAAILGVYGRDLANPRLWPALLWGTLPAAVAGLALRPLVASLFGSLPAAALGWTGTALVLWWCARRLTRRTGAPLGIRGPDARGAGERLVAPPAACAVFIGCFQAMALLPGLSRSGLTLAAGLACGLPPRDAARFAFLLSVPAVAGAALVSLPGATAGGMGVTGLWLGAGIAAVSGILAIRWFVGRVDAARMTGLAVYCAALAALALALP